MMVHPFLSWHRSAETQCWGHVCTDIRPQKHAQRHAQATHPQTNSEKVMLLQLLWSAHMHNRNNNDTCLGIGAEADEKLKYGLNVSFQGNYLLCMFLRSILKLRSMYLPPLTPVILKVLWLFPPAVWARLVSPILLQTLLTE